MEKATCFDELSQEVKDKIENKESCEQYIFYKNTAKKDKKTTLSFWICWVNNQKMVLVVGSRWLSGCNPNCLYYEDLQSEIKKSALSWMYYWITNPKNTRTGITSR